MGQIEVSILWIDMKRWQKIGTLLEKPLSMPNSLFAIDIELIFQIENDFIAQNFLSLNQFSKHKIFLLACSI